jgi:cytochrome c55X
VALVSAFLTIAGGAAAEPPSSERQDQLLHLLKHDCGSCHGLTMKGGLGPSLLPGALRDKDEDALVAIVLDGVPGTPMPPWRFELSEDEAAWLIRSLSLGDQP